MSDGATMKNAMSLHEWRQHLELTIRRYFDGCNEADIEKMAGCFEPDATHYFPPGMYGGAWHGARAIAERWSGFVASKGSSWTIDRLICEPESDQAVIEWTHVKALEGRVLRGDEWYLFDPRSGLISEIRAYYAAPQDATLEWSELDGFDYRGRGYAHSRDEASAR